MKQAGNDSRPKKRKTLHSKIQEVFQKQLSAEDVQTILSGLEQKGWIVIKGDKVTYQF